MSILVSGSLVYDNIMNFPDSFKNHILPDQIHIINVSFIVDKVVRSWGGTAGNIGFCIKLLGEDPLIVSAVGKDGDAYLEHLKSAGLKTNYIKKDSAILTASAYITTDQDDNQITAFHGGPLESSRDISLHDVKEHISVAIISPNAREAMIHHLKEAQERELFTVFDPGQQMTAFSGPELRRMIGQADCVIGNDYEMKLLQTRTEWDAQEILKYTKILITTLGERGSTISTADSETIEVGSCPPQSFDDPTGAGDAFRAGFFVGYSRGLPLKTCGQIGSVSASYAIETYGTQEHTFTLDEFKNRYLKTYNEPLTF